MTSILAMHHPSFEVVIVEQGAKTTALPDDRRLRHIHSDTRGKSAGLNLAVSHSHAAIFSPSPTMTATVPEDWLVRGEVVLARWPHVSLLYGDLSAVSTTRGLSTYPSLISSDARCCGRRPASYFGIGVRVPTYVRPPPALRVGRKFDEQIGPGARFRACEEFDLSYRTLTAGFSVAVSPEVSVVHWGARSRMDRSEGELLHGYAVPRRRGEGKHLRLGDVHMVPVVLRTLTDDGRAIASEPRPPESRGPQAVPDAVARMSRRDEKSDRSREANFHLRR